MQTSQLQSQTFYKATLPIVEIDTDYCAGFYFVKAAGYYNDQEIGLNLLINSSFKPMFDVSDGDVTQVISVNDALLVNGLVMWGGEDILYGLVNGFANVWGRPTCPVTNDLNCDGYMLWGDFSKMKSFEASSQGQAVIEAVEEEFVLSLESPREVLRFKSRGLYYVRTEEDHESYVIESVSFFIYLDLIKMTLEIAEEDLDYRDNFLKLFWLPESSKEERLQNKGRIMLVTKVV